MMIFFFARLAIKNNYQPEGNPRDIIIETRTIYTLL